MTMDSEYVPALTTTEGIALFCAAAMAALIAVNCADPSRATVMAVAAADDTATNEDVVGAMAAELVERTGLLVEPAIAELDTADVVEFEF